MFTELLPYIYSFSSLFSWVFWPQASCIALKPVLLTCSWNFLRSSSLAFSIASKRIYLHNKKHSKMKGAFFPLYRWELRQAEYGQRGCLFWRPWYLLSIWNRSMQSFFACGTKIWCVRESLLLPAAAPHLRVVDNSKRSSCKATRLWKTGRIFVTHSQDDQKEAFLK